MRPQRQGTGTWGKGGFFLSPSVEGGILDLREEGEISTRGEKLEEVLDITPTEGGSSRMCKVVFILLLFIFVLSYFLLSLSFLSWVYSGVLSLF